MKWVCDLSADAQEDLAELPKQIQKRIAQTIDQMESGDPFQGDVKPLHGKDWTGIYRRRIGDYRLLFHANQKEKTFTVVRILIRSEKTYR